MGVPQEAFDEVLRLGSNERNSVLRILANHQLGNTDFAEFLRNEFLASGHEGGRGIVLGREPYAVWFEQEGIRIARGNTVRSADSVLFTWQEAAAEIDDLIHTGAYAPAELIDDAIPHMRLEAAQSIWYLHQDLAQDATFFLSEEQFSGKGFPDATLELANLLDDPLYLAQALQGLRMFAAELRDNPDLLRFHIAAHSPERIRQRLELLQNEPTFYPSVIREHETPTFITEDEIDDTLGLGSNYAGSRQSIYRFFSEHKDAKERADFLKAHYGTGGRSHSVSHADNSFLDYDSSGLALKRGNEASIKLKWNAVAKRIDALIQSGRYLTQEELTELEEREEEQALADEGEQEANAEEVEEPDEPQPAEDDFRSGDDAAGQRDVQPLVLRQEGRAPVQDGEADDIDAEIRQGDAPDDGVAEHHPGKEFLVGGSGELPSAVFRLCVRGRGGFRRQRFPFEFIDRRQPAFGGGVFQRGRHQQGPQQAEESSFHRNVLLRLRVR